MLFMTLSCNVKVLKLYSVKGKLKKDKLIKKFKNLEPYEREILNENKPERHKEVWQQKENMDIN